MDDFIARALLAGTGVALIAGPLGCLMIWKRMIYFGAAISHSSLLGISLGLLLGMGVTSSLIMSCLLMTVIFHVLNRINWLNQDTLLGILAHGALAAGLVIITITDTIRVDLMSYLFGDILSVSHTDLWIILLITILIITVMFMLWQSFIAATLNTELAAVEGIAVKRNELIYILLLALAIAIGMKVVGLLLVVSMLIIPAAIARLLSKTPEQMAILASAIGIISVIIGIYFSVELDWPTGPAIVLVSAAIFIVAHLFSRNNA